MSLKELITAYPFTYICFFTFPSQFEQKITHTNWYVLTPFSSMKITDPSDEHLLSTEHFILKIQKRFEGRMRAVALLHWIHGGCKHELSLHMMS